MTSTYLKALTLALLLMMFNACEDDKVESSCGPRAIISEDFDTAPSNDFTIADAFIDGHCLAIEIGASGCDGESWATDLLVSTVVLFSDPPQVGIRMTLKNEELCQAFFKRTFYFDLRSLEEFGDRVEFRLDGWDGLISYPEVELEQIQGSWNLINVSGGLAGINDSYNKGLIIWSFGENMVEIENRSVDENYLDTFESGKYPYQIINSNNQLYQNLKVDGLNLGSITTLNNRQLIVDQRAADGFLYFFER
ncbi:MAG: hypothetical protein AAFY41_02560 [Bacteroidota bacterium]